MELTDESHKKSNRDRTKYKCNKIKDNKLKEKEKKKMAKGQKEKEIIEVAQALSEDLISGNYKEAYTHSGKLNALLKGEDIIQLPISKIEELKKQLRFYYKNNTDYQEISRKMYGVGKHLADVVSGL